MERISRGCDGSNCDTKAQCDFAPGRLLSRRDLARPRDEEISLVGRGAKGGAHNNMVGHKQGAEPPTRCVHL